jgi:uncharacterized membrane protein YfcA
MGFKAGAANALTAPPSCTCVFFAFAFAWVGDRYRVSAPIIAVQTIICLVGLVMVRYVETTGVRYFGIFLGLIGCQANIPAVLSYQSNNIRTQSKRIVSSALQIGFGAIGGIVASTVFIQRQSPTYTNGFLVAVGMQVYILLACAVLSAYFWHKNGQLDRGELKKPLEGQEGFKYFI